MATATAAPQRRTLSACASGLQPVAEASRPFALGIDIGHSTYGTVLGATGLACQLSCDQATVDNVKSTFAFRAHASRWCGQGGALLRTRRRCVADRFSLHRRCYSSMPLCVSVARLEFCVLLAHSSVRRSANHALIGDDRMRKK
jgi:hypothetical protein